MTLPLFARAPTGPQLRPYQEQAVEAVQGRWHAGDRATLLVLATGLGKTIVFSEVVRRLAERGTRSLVLAHRSELIEQAAEKLESLGLDVGIEQAQRRAAQHSVVVGSVQTLQGRRLERWTSEHFGLVVIDEAHHAAAASYRSILSHFAGARVLGVTATPDRGDGKGLGGLFDSVAFRLEIADGIQQGWLAPITAKRVVVDGLDLSAVRTTAGDLNQGDLDLALRAPAAVHGVAEPLAVLSRGRPTLAFCVTVEHAHAVADAVNRIAPGTAEALDGGVLREHRAAVLRRYQAGQIRVLVNCALFTEGFDAPATSCVAIVRPTKSRALYAQMVGRGTRLSPGKTDCRVLDFAGVAGKHRLAGPVDVLAGDELDDEQREEVERRLAGGAPEDVLATIEAVKEARREGERPKADPIAWTSVEVDLFGDVLGELRADWIGLPVLAEQREFLEQRGVDVDRLDKAQASVLIGAIRERQKEGLCTYKQAKLLARWGIPVERLAFGEATGLIDSLARQQWKPSPTWVERARLRAEQIARPQP
jgi:superfamily II DNA or RNA helicase